MTPTWLTDKQMALRYSCSRKWIWDQAKRDPDFPRPIKFTHGCTRWSAEAAAEYDAKKMATT
jgi:predicted DNA-binding transcriptional regulator AlpA